MLICVGSLTTPPPPPPRTLRHMRQRVPLATGVRDSAEPTAGTQSCVHCHHAEGVPSNGAWDFTPASPNAPPPSQTVVVAQPDAKSRATGYPAPAPAITVLLKLFVRPPCAWKSELQGRKRARLEFVALTWVGNMETQDGDQIPPPNPLCTFHFFTLALGVQLKEGEPLLALYAYRLRGGIVNGRARFGGGRGWLRDSCFGMGCSRSLG